MWDCGGENRGAAGQVRAALGTGVRLAQTGPKSSQLLGQFSSNVRQASSLLSLVLTN